MGKGRKRLPDVIKSQRGTLQKCRTNNDVPVVDVVSKMPPTPKVLNKYGKRMWRKVGQLLIDTGILTPLNIGTFQVMCLEYGIYMAANERMAELDDMFEIVIDKNSNKTTKVAAIRKISDQALTNYTKLAESFGLSPTAISKITIKKKDKTKDGFSEFLS